MNWKSEFLTLVIMEENIIAAKRLQRFYRNYVKWQRSPSSDGTLWPVDTIMDEPFDPSFQIRILMETGSKLPGKRHRLELYNIGSLWQSINISHSVESPISTKKFTKEQFTKIADTAIRFGIATDAQKQHALQAYYSVFHSPPFANAGIIVPMLATPQLLAIINHQKDIIIAGLKGDNERVMEILLEHGDDIDQDRFLPNKFFTLSSLKNHSEGFDPIGILPDVIIHINAPMAIAYGCDADTFASSIEQGCDPKLPNPEGYTPFHTAAYAKNTPILSMATVFNYDLGAEANDGTSVLSIIDGFDESDLIYSALFE